jgi:hypothetical protein
LRSSSDPGGRSVGPPRPSPRADRTGWQKYTADLELMLRADCGRELRGLFEWSSRPYAYPPRPRGLSTRRLRHSSPPSVRFDCRIEREWRRRSYNSGVNERRRRAFLVPTVSMMGILSGAARLMMDVRQTGSGPLHCGHPFGGFAPDRGCPSKRVRPRGTSEQDPALVRIADSPICYREPRSQPFSRRSCEYKSVQLVTLH